MSTLEQATNKKKSKKASTRKSKKSRVSLKVLNFKEEEQEDDAEKDLEDEEKQEEEADEEKDPKAKKSSTKKVHSHLIFVLKKKKASKSGTSSQKKTKTKEVVVMEIEDDDPTTEESTNDSSTANLQVDDGKGKQDNDAGVRGLNMDDLKKLILTVKGEQHIPTGLITTTPFTKRVRNSYIPESYHASNALLFDGTADLVEYMSHFNTKIDIYQVKEPTRCRLF